MWFGLMCVLFENVNVFFKMENGLCIWVGVGGSLEFVVCVVCYGLGLMFVIIGGLVGWFKLFVDLYYCLVVLFGIIVYFVVVYFFGYIVDIDVEVWDQVYLGFEVMNNIIGCECGWFVYS